MGGGRGGGCGWGGGRMTDSPGRAGRNLPIALAVGLGLGALILTTLYLYPPAFLAVVVVAVCIGMQELVRALGAKDMHPPLVPLLAGTVTILCVAYFVGRDAMTTAMLLTIPAILLWRIWKGVDGLVADMSSAVFALIYVGFLAGFAALLLSPHDGDRRVTCFVATCVASDFGGYGVRSLFG